MELSQTVIDAIRQVCGAEDIRDKDLLREDLGMDSLGMVTLLVLLEDAFNVEFDESDMDPFDIQTVEDVFELVQRYADEGEDKGNNEQVDKSVGSDYRRALDSEMGVPDRAEISDTDTPESVGGKQYSCSNMDEGSDIFSVSDESAVNNCE